MRVTIAAVVCLVVLVRADSASAYAGAADGSRAVAAAICAEPTLLVEVVMPGEAIGGDEREGLNEAGTLWCVSPDDPRCSPLDTSGQNGVSLGNAKLGVAVSGAGDPFAPLELAATSGVVDYRGRARDAVLGRLERPPNRRAA
ncbi:MAG TPA: hypothetical protein VFG30_05995 [Polyangiales bacterium]|nr:hypothetical protein [Polyangiales bacterium]